MTNLSTEHLIKCIVEKDKYKHSQQYLKEVELENEAAFNCVNQALYNLITTTNYPPSSKLYALRFFKDLIISAQFHLIDGLDQHILKQIIKTSQFDKDNPDKNKRGSLYFQQTQKRKKQADLEKVSFSYVLFSTEIIYVMGVWHALDQNNQTSDYAVIYQKLKKSKVPFPQNDQELKFFKPQEKDLFLKNYKEWVQKLPQIQEESEEADDKENSNLKSKKSIRSKQKLTLTDEPKQKISSQFPLLAKDQNKITQRSQSQTKRQIIQSSKVVRTVIDESEFKKLKEVNEQKNQEIIKLQQKIKVLTKKNKDYEARVSQLELTARAEKDLDSTHSKTEQQKLRIKLTSFENKYSLLENKFMILEKDAHQLKSKLQQSQSLREGLTLQLQQHRHSLKKNQTQKAQTEEKYKITLSETQTDLSLARQKIVRLEREIQQLNTIKKSYKTIIQESLPQQKQTELQIQQKQHQIKVHSLQETVQLYTKQNIQLTTQIKELKSCNQKLQNLIESKDQQIQSLNNQIHEKSNSISLLQADIQTLKFEKNSLANLSHLAKQKSLSGQSQNQVPFTGTIERQELSSLQVNRIEPELKTQTQLKKLNSMSDYLLSQAQYSKKQSFPFEKTKQQTDADHFQVTLLQKVKNKSLGKTEKSEEKLKQKKQRYSAVKTFHFTNYNHKTIQQSSEINSNRLSQMNTAIQKAQSNSFVWKPVSRAESYKKFDHQQSFCKKTSALYLERKPYFVNYQTPKPSLIQTMVPFIDNYFSQKSNMSYRELTVFKSLCLSPVIREKQPIFVDHNIQAKLLPNLSGSKEFFVLQVINTGYSSIKVKAVSCHDQFKIVGEKLRFINSNSSVEYRIETKNKDLNLRYPIVSLIVTQDQGNRTKNLAYNVPLPLTLVEFTQMKKEIPNFYELEGQKLKLLKSEEFSLNSRFESLRQLFPHLSFTQKVKATRMQLRQIEMCWQGNLLHSFIENVDCYFKMSQVGSQVNLEFAVRDYDIVSENYAKAMIQTLMFFLQ